MVTHQIEVSLWLTPRSVRNALLLSLLFALPRCCTPADITSTTVYWPAPLATFPDPNGIDPSLIVTNSVELARDRGAVYIGNEDAPSPYAKLFVGREPTGTGTFENPVPSQQVQVFGALQVDGCILLNNQLVNPGANEYRTSSDKVVPSPAFDLRNAMWRCRWGEDKTN